VDKPMPNFWWNSISAERNRLIGTTLLENLHLSDFEGPEEFHGRILPQFGARGASKSFNIYFHEPISFFLLLSQADNGLNANWSKELANWILLDILILKYFFGIRKISSWPKYRLDIEDGKIDSIIQ